MTSWRASASDEAQQDLDGLFALSIEFAEGQLRDRGEFYPYAAVVRTDGGSQMVAAAPAGPDDHPESVDVIASCVAALTSMRDRIRAAAVV